MPTAKYSTLLISDVGVIVVLSIMFHIKLKHERIKWQKNVWFTSCAK